MSGGCDLVTKIAPPGERSELVGYHALSRIHQSEPHLFHSGRPRSLSEQEATLSTIYLGVDASKGYADLCFLNDAHSILHPSARFDDTPAGHAGVRQAFAEIRTRQPGVSFQVGVEASGGLERNWLRLLHSLGEDCRVFHVNPLVVKRFLDQDLHRNTTDPISARGIAAYLRDGTRKAQLPDERYPAGTRTLYRYVANSMQRAARIRNELQSLLPSVHPDLVRFCRQGIPAWVLQLLVRYPTVSSLCRA